MPKRQIRAGVAIAVGRAALALAFTSVLLIGTTWGQAQTKLAFVAGIEDYDRDGFARLNYAEDDALELKNELEKLGFETIALVGKDSTQERLNRSLSDLFQRSKKLRKDDIVLVFFSGHGVQKEMERRTADGKPIRKEEPFFCPVDAHKNDVSTLLSMNDVLQKLIDDSGASNNIVLLDACRESADKSGKGIDGSTIDALPNKLALFFAAQSGHKSFESSKLKHGIFTHFLLEGLKGEAADRDNEITLQGLTSYVSKRVQRDSPDLLDVAATDAQQPNLMGNLRGALVLGTLKAAGRKEPSSGDSTAKKVSLIAPGQKFSDAEKEERRRKAVQQLTKLKDLEESHRPSFAYIRGKVYGVEAMKFRLEDPSDVITYFAELEAVDRNIHGDIYNKRSESLAEFLSQRRNEFIPLRPETYRAYTSNRPALLLAAFDSEDLYTALPAMIRPLMAQTTSEQRRVSLPFNIAEQSAKDKSDEQGTLQATDQAVLSSLMGDYRPAASPRKFALHIPWAVVPPVLAGDLEAAHLIARSQKESLRNASFFVVADTLLDESQLSEARKAAQFIDFKAPASLTYGSIPLPQGEFWGGASAIGRRPLSYLAGRLDDEGLYSVVLESESSIEQTIQNIEQAQHSLRLAFVVGLVRDL